MNFIEGLINFIVGSLIIAIITCFFLFVRFSVNYVLIQYTYMKCQYEYMKWDICSNIPKEKMNSKMSAWCATQNLDEIIDLPTLVRRYND